MATNKKGHLARNEAARTTGSDYRGNSVEAQRLRLLEALQAGPMSTLDIRAELDILAPAVRVFELKHKYGHNIQSTWTDQPTDGGRMHRVARYALFPSPQLELLDGDAGPTTSHPIQHS